MFRKICALGPAVALAGTAACSGSSGGGGSRDTLVVYTGQAGDFQLNFNPYAPTQIEGPGTIYESLFFFNIAKDQPPKPMLGTEFKWNADGTELSVTLRDNVTWSDGEKFTAEDVKFTLDMVAKTPAINKTGFKGVTTAVDDTHVTVKFPEPSYMDGPQVLGQLWIMPEHIWKNYATPQTEVNQNPVGTGPFQLGDFKAQSFTLKSNPKYWGGEPALKQVRYLSLSGNQAGVDALKAGSIDWLCMPRFDSPACFAALLGTPENGFWSIAPADPASSSRRYLDSSLVLETRFETAEGVASLVDCMPIRAGRFGTGTFQSAVLPEPISTNWASLLTRSEQPGAPMMPRSIGSGPNGEVVRLKPNSIIAAFDGS